MRVQSQPAFVLHARPYRETSLIVEAFSRCCGRVGLVAKGARNPKSRMRPLLLPFQSLLLGWSGKGDLALLTGVEGTGAARELDGHARYAGFYLNELLLRLLHRHDPHEGLFDRYTTVLAQLHEEGSVQDALRIFEKHLLIETGYGMVLDHDASSGEALQADALYRYVPDRGPVKCEPQSNATNCVHGQTLLELREEAFRGRRSRLEARYLLRFLLEYQLAGHDLRSRRIFHQVLSRLESRPDQP